MRPQEGHNLNLKVLTKEQLQQKIAVVVGTRPGIIKFSPVIKELTRRKADFFIIHTGQHYSFNMDRTFFEALELPMARYTNEKVRKCKSHGAQTAEMIRGVEEALLEEKPAVVIVGGDANTNLAGALAARKLGITLAHMEAGLRSDDWSMPEEHNRVMIDHISDILFAPTEETKENLVQDNVRGKIFITGNTIVEAVRDNVKIAAQKSDILAELSVHPREYFLLTFHREENVDNKRRLENFLHCIYALDASYSYQIIFPIHPRTQIRLKHFELYDQLQEIASLQFVEALGYFDFLKLLSNARLVLTDSGGIQEESCILKVPCVTLRENTERPETVEVGANIVASTAADKVLEAVGYFLREGEEKNWKQPFGDKAAQKIADVLVGEIKKSGL
jgi:UDP-N-acetylglucosamine 2-epimerase (non-hydrolysing)